MASNRLTIYSSDGQKLQTAMGFFIRPTMRESRVNPSKQDVAIYIPEFVSTSRANNDCLISINTKGDGVTVVGVLRTRQNAAEGPAIKDYTLSETPSPGEDAILSLARGVKEELGSLIHPGFIHSDKGEFILVVDVGAKARILNNYQRLVPITEIYDVQWVATPVVPQVPNIVKDSDIYESDVLDVIDLAYASVANLPPPLQLELGYQTAFSAVNDPKSHTNAPHRVARQAPVLPRQKGSPPAPPAAPAAAAPAAPAYPEPIPGESLNDYVTRASQGLPSAAKAPIRIYGRKLGLKGGKTIRRKKSKRSKRKGTLKREVRR